MWIENGRLTMDISESRSVPNGEFMTVREYAENGGYTIGQVNQWIRRGQIESYLVPISLGKLYNLRVIPVGSGPRKR